MTVNGVVWAWGDNKRGQVGMNVKSAHKWKKQSNDKIINEPVVVFPFEDEKGERLRDKAV